MVGQFSYAAANLPSNHLKHRSQLLNKAAFEGLQMRDAELRRNLAGIHWS
jgi:hypothetical protein